MAAKSWRQVALECMRRPSFPTPYFPDSYALNEGRPLGRRARGGASNQYERAVLVMGRYLDSRAFSASTNPDFAEIAYRDAAQIADLASRSWAEIQLWNQIFVAEPYTAAIAQTSNSRIGMWEWRLWIKSVSTGLWSVWSSAETWSGHLADQKFGNEYPPSPPSGFRTEQPSGIVTAKPVYDLGAPFASDGFPYWIIHGYAGQRAFPTPSDVADILVCAKVTQFLDDPTRPDDTREGHWATAIGCDPYPTPSIYDYPSTGCSIHRRIRARWPEHQYIVMHTMTEAQFNAPGGFPPFYADAYETYDEGGPIVFPPTPAGPAPTKGRWVDIYNPSSPKGRWTDIAASANVAPSWGPATQLTATIGVAFSFTPPLLAGTPAPTFSKVSGPSWASVNSSTGQITGTPTGSPTSTTIVVRATNAAAPSGVDITLPLEVVAAPIAPVVTTTSLPNAEQNAPYYQALAATGTGPFTWSIASGALPAGMTLSASSGVISGAATATGTASFTVRATGPTGLFDDQALSIVVGAAGNAPAITTVSLPDSTAGSAYSQTLGATGATPRTWTIVAGALPPGMTLNASTGAITGTSSVPGGYAFTVRLANAYDAVELQLSIRVLPVGASTAVSPWTAVLRGR